MVPHNALFLASGIIWHRTMDQDHHAPEATGRLAAIPAPCVSLPFPQSSNELHAPPSPRHRPCFFFALSLLFGRLLFLPLFLFFLPFSLSLPILLSPSLQLCRPFQASFSVVIPRVARALRWCVSLYFRFLLRYPPDTQLS
ncbi:hypothetical protein VTN77DRAFT_6670 [Rasamsonia byssochlamydoides]|uniref:uncharacterized protein n=1 Tax=Rasamsonia byssochlamydoides TaxID=89139 RepID=UPI0037440158